MCQGDELGGSASRRELAAGLESRLALTVADTEGLHLLAFAERFVSSPGRLRRPDYNVDGLDERLVLVVFIMQRLKRGTAELVRSAEQDT
jgi:hypothetical protein